MTARGPPVGKCCIGAYGTVESAVKFPLIDYSGFHLEVELTSRGGDAPPARRARGAVGGAGHIVTTIRYK